MFCCREVEASNEYDKADVVAACERTLKSIRSSRDEAHEEQITRDMRKRKLFLGPMFTRDEAIYRQKEMVGITSQWGMIEALYGAQERTCEMILTATGKSNKDTFWLTKSEAYHLHW